MSSPQPVSSEHTPLACDAQTLKHLIRERLIHAVGKDPLEATARDWLHAVSIVARDHMIERRMYTKRHYQEEGVKRVYYLSMEFLIGRMLINGLLNMGFFGAACEALEELGVDLHTIEALEPDAALGNGGLGRLAACILDSLATHCYPAIGYGIRYEFGMFHQEIDNGQQIEHPDNWLRYGNPWEYPRSDHLYEVRFYGQVTEHHLPHDGVVHVWEDGETVMAMAYDYSIPGYGNKNVNNLRLWAAKASRDFDLTYFNVGDYVGAVEDKNQSETISKVLYPNDATAIGRELRLKQEYFFVSASLQDILDRLLREGHDITELPDYVAIQLNDTHPAIAVAEMMRLLVDEYQLEWTKAWDLCVRTFAYTNHTLMPEALEVWPVALMEAVLPRHMQIIYQINHDLLTLVRHHYPGDIDRVQRMSLIDEGHGRQVRMAYLAIFGSHAVNGVAALHSRLLTDNLFKDFYELFPERFLNITNGITPRLWLHQANPGLRNLLRNYIQGDWASDLDLIRQFESSIDDEACRHAFREVKLANKHALAEEIRARTGIEVNPEALFDVQIKRIHEYKRQLLNLLHVITLYNLIRAGEYTERVPRVVIFGGKAAPGYEFAKRIIYLINDVADVINNDPAVGDRLRLVFLPNYSVSLASIIIPAADLSEQISTAGTEASGTGNMKLSLNGALTIGTLDGANIEIREEVGEDNFFLFGLRTEEVASLRSQGYSPRHYYESNAHLKQALDMIVEGFFSPEEPELHRGIAKQLMEVDPYLVLADYADYVAVQAQVDLLYRDQEAWTRRAMLNTARMGKFSIDRTVKEYSDQIWNLTPTCFV
ncbi:MAG: glycogen/starch/alpha-glucan phosphorylase [Gammaproteobacteria bacterium]